VTSLTDQWLRTEFQDHARTIDPPADLHQESMRRARATRKRRKGLQAGLTVGLAAAVTGVIVIVAGALSPSSAPAPAGPAPATWTFDLYFVDMAGINNTQQPTLVSEPVTVPNTGDKPLDIVNALMGSVAEGKGTNGFNFSSEGQYPIAKVNSVTVDPDVIVVDLDRNVWDPYPAANCLCPSGDMVMQQLVWTLNSALDRTLPVLLTINGEPARGIWFHRLNGPVSMEPGVSGYPTNASGQTYGDLPTSDEPLSNKDIPDLVGVMGNNGEHGYITKRAFLGGRAPANPEQALEIQATAEPVTVPVYAADGVTVIDTFTIGSGER
jgi:hypothetical protein